MKPAAQHPGARRASAAILGGRLVGAMALVLALAACNAHGKRRVASWVVADPSARHPIIVSRKEVVLDIDVPPGSYGLTHNQKNDLRVFANRFKSEDGGGVLVVRAPNGGRNEIAAMRALDDVRRVLARAGVARPNAAFESYFGGETPAPPIRVSFMRHLADGPECGDWSDSLVRDPKNMPYRNLGCAQQRNLAAMVANPRDLIEPRGVTPRSSERRDTIWKKYLKGETTVSEKAEEEKSKVSDVKGGGK